MTKRYWTGGPAKIRLCHPESISKADSKAAVRMLDDFRAQCQGIWFAFDGLINGRPLALQKWQQKKVGKHNRLTVGTQLPNQERSIGRSTFAQITFGELLEATADGGEFEQLNTQALLVFIDTLWEESTRHKIAALLNVDKRDVKCDLFADLRLVRNLTVHKSEQAKRDHLKKATLLPEIWKINPDAPVITASVAQALMEQLNAMHVHVGEVRSKLGRPGDDAKILPASSPPAMIT